MKIYALLMVLSAFLGVAKQFMYAKMLGVDGFGYYAIALLVQSYGMYVFTFGLNEGLIRELTFYFSRGQYDGGKQLRNKTLTFLFFILGLSIVLLLVIAPVSNYYYGNTYNVYLLGVLYSISTIVFNFTSIELKARQNIKSLSKYLLLKNVYFVLFGFVLIILGFSAVTVVISEIVVQILMAWYLLKVRNAEFTLDFNMRPVLVPVMKLGLPFMLTSFLRNVINSFDKVFITAFFTITVMGQYSFAMILFSGGLVFQNILSTAFQPYAIADFAKYKQPYRLFKYAIKVSVGILMLFAIGFYPVINLIEYFVIQFYAEYAESLTLIPFIYVAMAFMSVNIFDSVLLATGAGLNLFKTNVMVSIIYVLLCFYVAFFPGKLAMENFVLVFCISQFFLYLGALATSYVDTKTYIEITSGNN